MIWETGELSPRQHRLRTLTPASLQSPMGQAGLQWPIGQGMCQGLPGLGPEAHGSSRAKDRGCGLMEK